MQIDVWTDIACPFCYIGKRQLEAAFRAFEHNDEIELRWHSFQLMPDAPAHTDQSINEMLAERKGITVDDSSELNDRVTAMAATVGLTYRFDIAHPANTLDAHRLIHLAAAHGLASPMIERLSAAYLTEGVHIGDHATLTRLAADVGLPADQVEEVLASDRFTDVVADDFRAGREIGVTGVPFMVFDRRYTVVGAQDAAVILDTVNEAWNNRDLGRVATGDSSR